MTYQEALLIKKELLEELHAEFLEQAKGKEHRTFYKILDDTFRNVKERAQTEYMHS